MYTMVITVKRLFVRIYHFLLQHISLSNISKPILRLPSDLPHLNILQMVIFFMHFLFVILKCASLVSVSTSTPPSLLISSPSPPPPTQIPSQTIGPSSSWGPMMTPREVQELLASQSQIGEYYVIIKGCKPGVYLSW